MRMFNDLTSGIVLAFFLLSISISALHAQQPKEEKGTINSSRYTGFSIEISDVDTKVMAFWKDYLIDVGKIRRKRDFLQVEELSLPDAFYPEAIFYTRVVGEDSTSRIWIALDESSLLAGEGGEELVNDALRAFVGPLPTEYEKFKVETQIAEAQQVIAYTNRQKASLVRESGNLDIKLANAKDERDRLKNTLENLELEILALAQRIENNKIAMAQADEDVAKILLMVEGYEEELRRISSQK